ncbi:MAG: class I SAM-dependent methyltransferase [Turicibacter sp.]
MIITTSFDETEVLVKKAIELAKQLNVPYVKRNKKTLKYLHEHRDAEIFVVNSNRGLCFNKKGADEIFYHPNMAFHRIKQIERGQKDSLVSACDLVEGMTFLDCTLGLASDTLVASYVVGHSGQIIATEKSFPLSVLVREGLHYYVQTAQPELKDIVEKLKIINCDNLEYLKSLSDDTVDVVYFDFMFTKSLESSQGIKVIKPLVSYDLLTPEHVSEARRVAKQKVVVKSNYGNDSINELGFEISKINQKRHFFYGVIDVKEHK